MRPPLSLLLAFVLVAGCDLTDTAAPARLVTLDAALAPAGDIFFDLAPLEIGEALAVAALVGDDRLTLRAVREADGYDLGLNAGRFLPGDVTVTYLSQGRLVTRPVPVEADDDLFGAGTSKNEPTSHHWEYVDGKWVLVYDFVETETGSTELRTTDGETLRVTHVVFTLDGLDTPAPRAIEFEAPRGVTIQSQRVGEPVAAFAALR